MSLPLQLVKGYDKLARLGANTFRGVPKGHGGPVTIKIESLECDQPHLENEASVYKSLTGAFGVPLLHSYYSVGDHRVMVTDHRYGPKLQDLFKFCDGKFDFKTILLLTYQLLTCVGDAHSKSVALGTINAGNFIIGSGIFLNQIFVVTLDHASHQPSPINSIRNDSSAATSNNKLWIDSMYQQSASITETDLL
jgi:casein kinase I family protein HRR25